MRRGINFYCSTCTTKSINLSNYSKIKIKYKVVTSQGNGLYINCYNMPSNNYSFSDVSSSNLIANKSIATGTTGINEFVIESIPQGTNGYLSIGGSTTSGGALNIQILKIILIP